MAATPYLIILALLLLTLFLLTSRAPAPGGSGATPAPSFKLGGGIKTHQDSVKAGDPEAWGGTSVPGERDDEKEMDAMLGDGSGDKDKDKDKADEVDQKRLSDAESKVEKLETRVDELEGELVTAKCDSFLAASVREGKHSGMCKAGKEGFKGGVFGAGVGGAGGSRSFAKLRAPDFEGDNHRWQNAKDHWKEVSHSFTNPVERTASFQLDLHNPSTEDLVVSAAINSDSVYGLHELNFMGKVLLEPNLAEGLVIDGGANIGYFTMWAAALGHRVIAFEPMDFNLRYLLKSINRNKFDKKISVYQNALANAVGKLSPDSTDTNNKGNIKLRPGNAGGMYGMDYVDGVKLDDLLDEDVLLLRLNTQGMDFKALDGARRLICNNVVRHIVVAFGLSREDEECSGLGVSCWLHSLGYTTLPLGPEYNELSDKVLPHKFREWSGTVSFSLPEPAVPPALALDIRGEGNLCASVGARIPRDAERWAKHQTAWCAKTLKRERDNLRPCVDWGKLKSGDKDTWRQLDCDKRLGFDCTIDSLREKTIKEAVKASDPIGWEKDDWLTTWINNNVPMTYHRARDEDEEVQIVGGGGGDAPAPSA